MQHEYRKTTYIKAEQFDGSEKMRRKYNIHDSVAVYGFKGRVESFLPDKKDHNMTRIINKGDWIVLNDGNCYPMSDDIFHKTYERVD